MSTKSKRSGSRGAGSLPADTAAVGTHRTVEPPKVAVSMQVVRDLAAKGRAAMVIGSKAYDFTDFGA